MRDYTDKCEGRCAERCSRSIWWCGYGFETPGEAPHGEHDWYSDTYEGWLHCYGTKGDRS